MTRRTWRQDAPRLLQLADDGVIKVAHLLELGVRSSVIHQRCQPGGPWQRLLPGVLLLHSGTPTWRQKLKAAQLYGGPDAVLTGAAAMNLHGLRRGGTATQTHLLIPHEDRRRDAVFVVVERTLRLPEPVSIQDVHVAPVVRAVLDFARRLRDRAAIGAALAEAVQRGFCSPLALSDELEAGNDRGSALVRRELADILEGARSAAEIDAKGLIRRSSVPAPLWNVTLLTPDGSYVGKPDAYWKEVAMAWEIDSNEFHFELEDHDRTLRRNARYAAAGVAFLQTKPSWIKKDPASVIAELEATYAAASRRPAPQLELRRAA